MGVSASVSSLCCGCKLVHPGHHAVDSHADVDATMNAFSQWLSDPRKAWMLLLATGHGVGSVCREHDFCPLISSNTHDMLQ